MTTHILTQDELKAQLHYNPDTGLFNWIITKKGVSSGSFTGNLNSRGYVRIMFNYKEYPAHRLAWLYMTGSMPKDFIDHINCIKNDNRWCNLREATNKENQYNTGLSKTNTSGFKGVRYHQGKCTWRADCRVNGVKKHIGSFLTAELAGIAYQEFAKQLHGDFYHN